MISSTIKINTSNFNVKKLFIWFLLFNFYIISAQLPFSQISPCSPHSICYNNEIVEVNPHGNTENGMRQGIWIESYYGKPYAKGKYTNGKRDSIWTYYNIIGTKTDTSLKNKLPSEKDFKKANIYSTVSFKNGKLNGNIFVFDNKNKIIVKARYRNDSIVDTLYQYQNTTKVNSISNYNKCYYDSAFARMNDLSYYEALLPFSEYRYYINKKSYYQYTGYTNGRYYLRYDKKRKGVFISTEDIYDEMLMFEGSAEGVFSFFIKGELSQSYSIEDGRRTSNNSNYTGTNN
jgi:hypothetical protein